MLDGRVFCIFSVTDVQALFSNSLVTLKVKSLSASLRAKHAQRGARPAARTDASSAGADRRVRKSLGFAARRRAARDRATEGQGAARAARL